MLSLIANLDPNSYTHRSYVISSGDNLSAGKAEDYERSLAAKVALIQKGSRSPGQETSEPQGGNYTIHIVPRARQIHQPLLTSPLSSAHCLLACLSLLLSHPKGQPDLTLTNGPATSLILILALTVLRYFAFLPFSFSRGPSVSGELRLGKMRVIYVESWARVKRPSLSGRIIVWSGLCDRVLVQWKGLERKGWGEFKGVLVQ